MTIVADSRPYRGRKMFDSSSVALQRSANRAGSTLPPEAVQITVSGRSLREQRRGKRDGAAGFQHDPQVA